MANKYFHIKVNLKEALKESVVDYSYAECGCEGVQHYSIDEAQVDDILGERAFSAGDVTEDIVDEITMASENELTSFFFLSEENVNKFKKYLSEKKIELVSEDVEEVKDWNENWKKTYEPIIVSDDLKVVPEWEKKQDSINEIFINPGMGFGTGTHETTFLCLKLYKEIEEEVKVGSYISDFGCGSGILGIAALKRRKVTCDFCDIDSDALDNCVQNLELNHYQDYNSDQRLVIRDRYQFPSEEYSLVFANILNHVLISEKPMLLDNLQKDGYLIVSGLLNHQVDEIKDNYADQCIHIKTLSKGDWSAILFKKL
ncbi:MAG: methyltransferase [Oligoflexia bacterium]|nr:methyltransferase [Oligoflexia bacterium]